jgi:adenylate cyclase
VLPDFIPYYSIGHFIGFAVNGVFALLCLAMLGFYRTYKPLRSLFLFYLFSAVLFWGEVTYGLQKSPSSILLGYRISLAALALLPASWTWFISSLFNEKPRIVLCVITGISLLLIGFALLGRSPYLLSLPLEIHQMAPDILRPQSRVLKPAIYSFCLMACLFSMLSLSMRIRRSGNPRPVYLVPVVIGLLFWLLGGLHDALRSVGIIALMKGQVIWFTSLWLTLFLTAAMALHVRALEKTVHEARDVFERFVPPAYLRRIAAGGLGSIRLGEADRQTVTILSCDIRGFTTLSEELDPGDLVGFINRLFHRFTRIVDARQGIIDKFLGDALLCLFEGTGAAQRAVACGVDLLSDVQNFNNTEVPPDGRKVRIGIGLHSGPVILGTIGSPARMDSTVLGLTVNLAKRLEELTKHLGVDMVISDQVAGQIIRGPPHRLRMLGEILIKGSSVPVTIAEVYDHEVLEIRDLKNRVVPAVAEAMAMCRSGHFHAALSMIEGAKSVFPQDRSLQLLAASLARAVGQGKMTGGSILLDLRENKFPWE